MNRWPRRRRLWLSERRALCGAGDQRRHCFGEWRARAWLEPGERDRMRGVGR
jgi:hypothetical protein